MSCSKCDKVSISCGDTIYSPCVYFEVPEDLQGYVVGGSSTDPVECITLHAALEDIFTKLQDIEEQLDFTEFESDCIEPEEVEGEITLQTIITAFDEKICELKETVEGLDNICTFLDKDITDCDGLDFSCLETEDNCDNPIVITTLKSLIQVLIDKVCELENA